MLELSALSRWPLYLRASITEGCAFRCPYCQPQLRVVEERSRQLSAAHYAAVVRALADWGLNRVRLTGGEPLSRPDGADIVAAIREEPRIREVALTTNGERLAETAPSLAAAGLARINLHLDTLRPERFRQLGGRGELVQVLEGLEAARACGLGPLKINTVLMRGINDDELLDFCAFAREHGVTVRFIELMDTGPAPQFVREHFFSAAEARHRIETEIPLVPRFATRGAAPAREYVAGDGEAVVGFIASTSEPFCDACNRLRLTANGQLLGCLYQSHGVDLGVALRENDEHRIAEGVAAALDAKRTFHPRVSEASHPAFSMAEVGG